MAEEWVGTSPDRLIPNQIVYMRDPVVAAAEVKRNAARGFRSVCLSENPECLGLPSVHTSHWDPLLAACAETGTVINLHLGSSSTQPNTSSDAPMSVSAVMWPMQVMSAAAEWLFSQVCLRFPDIRIVFSEGGIGWVPVLLGRMEQIHRLRPELIDWPAGELTPMEVFHRNFWLSAIQESYSFEQCHRIGVDRIMLESDYPHADTSWPRTQEVVHEQVKRLAREEIAKVTHLNASELYGHPLPVDPEWWP